MNHPSEGDLYSSLRARWSECELSAVGAADPLLALVVVNYRSRALLERHLAALQLGQWNATVVIVDNSADAPDAPALQALAQQHDWYLLSPTGNLGFGAGVNLGMRFASVIGCSYAIVVNPDAVLTEAVVGALLEDLKHRPRTLISPTIRATTGESFFRGAELDLRTGRTLARRSDIDVSDDAAAREYAPWISGACIAIGVDFFLEVGGFDDRYFLYWEDVDLSFRVVAAGGTLSVRSDLIIVHDEGGTQERRSSRAKSDSYYYFNCRNRLMFGAARLPRGRLLRWILATPARSWEILMRGGKRQLLESSRPLLAAVTGSWAGLLVAVPALFSRSTQRGSPSPAGPRRVLMIHPGAELYGSDRVFLESVSALTDRQAEVLVVLPDAGPLVEQVSLRGAQVQIRPQPVLRKNALTALGALRLLRTAALSVVPSVRILRGFRPDTVYVSTMTIPSWLVLGRALRKRTVCHVHEAERSAGRTIRWLLAAPNRCAGLIIVNSEFSRRTLVDSMPSLAQRTTVLYNGVPGPPEVVGPRAELSGSVRLLYLGRLSPRKGPDTAIKVTEQLLQRGRDVELALLGTAFRGYEWYESQLRQLAQRPALQGRVRFLGFEENIWPRLASADVVLVPSQLDEPFGNTAVEAVLAARPLIVSDSSGLREAASGYASAQAVPPADEPAWTQAVEHVIEAWARFSEQAVLDAAAARARHSPTTYRAQLANLVLDGPSP